LSKLIGGFSYSTAFRTRSTSLLVLLAPDGGPPGAEDLPERNPDHDSQEGDPGDGIAATGQSTFVKNR